MAVDPICGMTVDESTAQWTSTVDGETFYFCNPMCKARFDAGASVPRSSSVPREPEPPRNRGTEELRGTEYVCPMDPEVVSDKPGPCPICGMALEPRVMTLASPPNPELADMKRRFLVS